MGRIRFRLVADGPTPAHLLTFPSGLPSDLDSMRFHADAGSDRLRIRSEGGHHQYDGSAPAPSPKFVVALFDAADGVVTLGQHGAGGPVPLSRVVDDADRSVERNVTSYAATKKMLIDEFGSKKRQRSMKAQDMNRVDIATAGSAGALKHALSTGAEFHESGGSDQTNAARPYLPAFDATTADREQIYRIEALIAAPVLLHIDVKALAARLKSAQFAHGGPGDDQFVFVVARLQALRQSRVGRDAVRDQLRQMALLSFMVDLYLRNSAMFDSGAQLAGALGCDDDVAEHLLQQFRLEKTLPSGKVVYTATGAYRVKLLCHICVLALIVSGFALSKAAFDLLRGDLKLTDDLLYTHFNQIGATIRRRNVTDNQVTVTLSAPLKLPPHSSGSAKRSK